jgi:hypothetical protein
MSTETHVFFRGKVPTKAVLSRAMKELGFPFSIKPADGSLGQQSGFMPMLRGRQETGVEFYFSSDSRAIAEFSAEGVDKSFKHLAIFRWSGDFEEAVAGMCGAAALAKLMNGVVFDEAEGKLFSVEGAIALARRNLDILLRSDPKPRMGTTPADIKRYLKPLLKERSDLALLGRRLIIRPVRHLLRGVFFDRTSDKYQFRLWRYVCPLFAASSDGVGYDNYIYLPISRVWEPDFQALLFNYLAEDLFDYVGHIETLEDFAQLTKPRSRAPSLAISALAVSGRTDSAFEMLNEIEKSDDGRNRSWIAKQRTFLARDVNSVCTEFRAKEAEAARQLKLGDLWEPCAFGAEAPEKEWSTRSAEPRFVTTPWISRPQGLIGDVPERPGEVRFAKAEMWRRDRVILLVPLARETAEELHRSRQEYVLATRLPGGNLLTLRHDTGWSPHDPEQPRNPKHVPAREYQLTVYGMMGCLQVSFTRDLDRLDHLTMWSISNLRASDDNNVWLAYNDLKAREKSVYDHRRGNIGRIRRELTDDDVALCELEAPPFGDFADMWRRVEKYLENEGFGRFW